MSVFVDSVEGTVTQRKDSSGDEYEHKDLTCLPPAACDDVFVLRVAQVAHYVWNKTDFDAVDPETTDYLMGECLYFDVLSLCPRTTAHSSLSSRVVQEGQTLSIGLLKSSTSTGL